MASQAELPRRTLVHEHPLVPSTEAYSPADCDQCKGEQESTESHYYCCVTEGCKYVLCGGCINLFTAADEQTVPAVAVVKDHHYHAELVERALAVVEEYLGTNAEISGAAILTSLLPRHLTKEQFTDLKAHLGARPLVGLLERSSRLRRDTVNDRVTRAKIGDADTRVAPPRPRDNTPSPAPVPSPSRPAIELMPAENDSAYYAALVERCVTIAVAEIRTKGEVSGADLFHTMLTRGDRFSESELADLKAHLGPKPLVELLRLTDKLQRGDYDRLYLAEDNTARHVSPRMESSPVPAPAPPMPALDNAPNGGSPLKRALLKRFIDGVVSRLQDTRTESLTSAAIFNPLGMMSHYVTSEELRELKEWFGPKPLVGLLVHAPQLRRVGKTDSVALALPNDGATGNDAEASPMLNEEAYHAQLVTRTVTLIVDHMNDNGFYYMPLHALWSKLLPQHFSKVEINDLRAYLGEKPLVALVGMTDKLARDAQNDRILLASRAHGSVHSSPAGAAPVEYEPEAGANGVANGHHANGHTPVPVAPLVTTTAATVVAAASAASGKALPTIGRKPAPAAPTTEPAPPPVQEAPATSVQQPAQTSLPSPPAPAHVEGPPGLPSIDRKSTEDHRHHNGEVANKQEPPVVTASPPKRMEGPPGLPPLSAAAPPASSSALKTTVAPPATSSAIISPPVSRVVRKRPAAAAVNWSEAVDVDYTIDDMTSTRVDVVSLADGAAASELSEHTLLGHNTTAHEPVYLNVTDPFCFVAVGAQGADMSHTLVNVIEGAMLRSVNGRTNTGAPLPLIKRASPMTTLVCSYDKRATDATPDIASVCLPGLSQDLCVKQLIILLSPSYFHTRRRAYQKQYPNCITLPLLFNYERLTPAQLMRFFSADPSGKIIDVFRECQRDRTRLSLTELTALIDELELPVEVKWPLQRRLELLDSLLVDIEDNAALFNGCDEELANVILDENLADLFTEGTMVLADLTDPMLDVHDANLIFDTLIDSFTSAAPAGKLLVLDEAHRYLGPEKGGLSDTVSSLVSSMHHSGLRVALSTQDPTTLPPRVLDMASVVAIHANHSPSWFNHLRASLPLTEADFLRIASLRTGNALVLSDRYKAGKGEASRVTRFAEEVRMRPRITRESAGAKSK